MPFSYVAEMGVTVVGRIDLHTKLPDLSNTVFTLQKTASPHGAEPFLAGIPPKLDAVSQKIAGLVAFGEKQKSFSAPCF